MKIRKRDADLAKLPAERVLALVDEVGLEDAGELVASATPEQLARVLDHDLWRTDDERFDDARFGLWLEVLSEMGAKHAAERLLSLDEGVVALGLSRLFAVFDADRLARELRSDDDEGAQVDKLLESSHVTELEGFLLVAKSTQHADAAVAILAELDEQHRDDLERILGRIAGLTEQATEDHGGLLALLSGEDQLESDVDGDRLDRRESLGFVSRADAAAFLALCARGAAGDDAISRAYLGTNRTPAAELAFLANVMAAHEQRGAVDAANRALALVKRGMRTLLQAPGARVSLLAAFAAGFRAVKIA